MFFTLDLRSEHTKSKFAPKKKKQKCSQSSSSENGQKKSLLSLFLFSFSFLTVSSRPTGKEDKCFYYAPHYNLERFEEAQGFIASNHFNAKVSSISFKGVFYLMSARLGDHNIRLSTTKALNNIRKDEEFEKGWRKGDFGLPSELRDLDLVHVVPLE